MAYAYPNEFDPRCPSGVNCPRAPNWCLKGDQWKGDKICDDDNNYALCDWDGGDCCGTDNNYSFCSVCECHDPAEGGSPPSCGLWQLEFKGDGYCHDFNNNAGCEWDGGDCCGTDNNYCPCSACECLDPDEQGSPPPAPPPSGCVYPKPINI